MDEFTVGGKEQGQKQWKELHSKKKIGCYKHGN